MSSRRRTTITATILLMILAIIIWIVYAVNHSSKANPKPTPTPSVTGGVAEAPPATAVTPGLSASPTPILLRCVPISDTGYFLPDPKCTPGAVTPGIITPDVCPVVNQDKLGRTVTAAQKAFVRQEYNDQNAGEVDHLIPLELGGSNGDDNLWVEDGPAPNIKDSVERKAHTAVCHGTFTLEYAQTQISTNWIAFAKELGVVLPSPSQ